MKKNTRKVEEKTYPAGEVLSMLEHINEGIEVIGEQYKGVVDRLDGIDARLDGIDDRLDGIDGRLDIMQEDITDIKFKLSEKVDREEFNKMEKRMTKLEKLVLTRLK